MFFIHDDFLLSGDSARRLFHKFARGEPILDYHNHLCPRDIALDRRFENLFELWLEGDHYKWRAMRAAGVEEHFITGSASPQEKFLAWAKTVPLTLRNPLYHWTHLELARVFDWHELLDEHTAPALWEHARERLQDPSLSARGLLRRFDVRALCTTDDPAHSLEWHELLAKAPDAPRVYPTFRPDKAFALDQGAAWNAWIEALGRQANIEIRSLDALLEALNARHAAFHALGGRLSDHGFASLPLSYATEREAKELFERARAGKSVASDESARWSGFLLSFLARLDAKRGCTKQFHLGPLRNTSSRALSTLGPDAGFDSMGDWAQVQGLATLFDRLDREGVLPRCILYNINPRDNYTFATMAGNFAPKVQFGAAWWFLDQKSGIEAQLDALSNTGLLSRFVGMLTDSRSFLSFPRHEYFRRVLCNLLGNDMDSGELPPDFELVGTMVQNICYANTRDFLGLSVG